MSLAFLSDDELRSAAAELREHEEAGERPYLSFGDQLIEPRINIICELYFNDWTKTYSTHTYSRTDDVCFLNGCIEYTVFSKFFRQCGCFAKHTTQTLTNVLSIQNTFLMIFH